MRLLFVNAVDPESAIDVRYPSLGLAYIATYVRESEPGVEVAILNSDEMEAMKAFAPDLVGVSAVSQNMGWAIRAARFLRRECPGVTLVLGGPHQMAVPDRLPEPFDFGVVGEGEECMLDIVRAWKRGARSFVEAMPGIPGTVWRAGGAVLHHAERRQLRDIDYLGIPDRDLIGHGKTPRLHMITSRGCPYKCVFCASAFNIRTARYASPELVIREIKLLVDRYGVKEIKIYDDLFTAHRTRLKEIADLMQAEGLDQTVRIECTNRANLTTRSLLEDCRRLGVRGLAFGFESGSQRVLEALKTDSVDVAQNRRSIRMCRDMGIEVCGSFILGTPGETYADLEATYGFLEEHKLDSCKIFVLTPHPGTPVWFEAERRGLVSKDMDWDLLSIDYDRHWERHIVLNDSMSRQEIRSWYLRFQRLVNRRELEKLVKRVTPRTVSDRLRHPMKLLNDVRVVGKKVAAIV
jgi:radical SAM superfamily enzyme YgiQ (UPF0313 family)